MNVTFTFRLANPNWCGTLAKRLILYLHRLLTAAPVHVHRLILGSLVVVGLCREDGWTAEDWYYQ